MKDILDKMDKWMRIGWLKIVSLNDVWKWILTGNEFHTLGAEKRKARDPKVKFCRGTESWWEQDERRDLVGSWYCKRSERYGGRPVCEALKVKVTSLSQWSWLRTSVEDSGDEWDCRYKTTRAAAYWIRWRRAVCLSGVPYRMEFNWSRREEMSADATEAARLSSSNGRICLKERI